MQETTADRVEEELNPILAVLQDMWVDFLGMLPKIGIGLVILILFYYLAKGVRSSVWRFSTRRRKHSNLGLALGRLGQAGVILLGFLISAVIVFPTFKPADLLTFLGIGGVAISFAFKDILQNFLAGILILITEPFRVGDQIIVGDSESSIEGTVEEIQTRATFLMTYDGRRVVIPNSDLYTEKVTVNTAYPQIRLEYNVGIGYGDDIELARQIILETAQQVEGVLDDPPPEALVLDLAESTVNIRVLWWVRTPRRLETLRAQDQVISAIKKALTENGVDLAFPTQVVLFHDQTEETDGDRSRQREGWPAGQGDAPASRKISAAILSLSEAAAKPGDGAHLS